MEHLRIKAFNRSMRELRIETPFAFAPRRDSRHSGS